MQLLCSSEGIAAAVTVFAGSCLVAHGVRLVVRHRSWLAVYCMLMCVVTAGIMFSSFVGCCGPNRAQWDLIREYQRSSVAPVDTTGEAHQ